MNSLLQSSLYGHDFIKYRKDHSKSEREHFSHSVRIRGIGEVPVVIDSVDKDLSVALAGTDATRYNRNGKSYRFHMELIIEDVLLEVKQRVHMDKNKVLRLGLENGKVLEDKDILGDLYKKYMNQDDKILYLLLTQETTMYGYIMSILQSILGRYF